MNDCYYFKDHRFEVEADFSKVITIHCDDKLNEEKGQKRRTNNLEGGSRGRLLRRASFPWVLNCH